MTNSVANDDDDDAPVHAPGAIALAPASGKQRALLALVITLGVLILLAFGVLIGGFVMGFAGGPSAKGAAAWRTTIGAPAGTRVTGAQAEGNRITVRLTSSVGEEIVVVDAGSGKVLGRIEVKPQQ